MSEEDLNTYNTENGAVDYLKTVFGLGADEDFNAYFNENLETMQTLGFDSAEKMIEAIQNGIEG
jgi:hypothetical protein